MGKTLADFRTALGSMIGFPTFTDLPSDEQAAIDTIVNAAYLECYAERNGRLPKWSEQYWAEYFKAPAAATLGLTSGNATVTGFAFEDKYCGSFIHVGDKFLRLGSVEAGPIYKLVQPWDGSTGSHAGTVYYNAVKLPGTVIDLCEAPTLLGVGPLTPLPYPESEIDLRSAPGFDFQPYAGRAPFAYSRPRFNSSLFTDVGDPVHYHVNTASTGSTFGTRSRIHLYPLPGAACTVDLRAVMLPAPLDDAADEPVLPNDESVDVAGAIMMPIAADLLLKHPLGRRYSGRNIELIMRHADDCRARLMTFARVQRRGPKRMGVASGF